MNEALLKGAIFKTFTAFRANLTTMFHFKFNIKSQVYSLLLNYSSCIVLTISYMFIHFVEL